jgi:hypothetical protein
VLKIRGEGKVREQPIVLVALLAATAAYAQATAKVDNDVVEKCFEKQKDKAVIVVSCVDVSAGFADRRVPDAVKQSSNHMERGVTDR